MKIKAPFRVTYDSSRTYRVWGFGLGYLPMQILGWGYNLRGSAGRLPFNCLWRENGKQLQIVKTS